MILEKIVKCEGGEIEVTITSDNEVYMKVETEIPKPFWCKRCKDRYACKSKLLTRWAVKEN